MMKLAIVIEAAFAGLESHAQVFLVTLDDHLCKPLYPIGFSFGFSLGSSFLVYGPGRDPCDWPFPEEKSGRRATAGLANFGLGCSNDVRSAQMCVTSYSASSHIQGLSITRSMAVVIKALSAP